LVVRYIKKVVIDDHLRGSYISPPSVVYCFVGSTFPVRISYWIPFLPPGTFPALWFSFPFLICCLPKFVRQEIFSRAGRIFLINHEVYILILHCIFIARPARDRELHGRLAGMHQALPAQHKSQKTGTLFLDVWGTTGTCPGARSMVAAGSRIQEAGPRWMVMDEHSARMTDRGSPHLP
jgi:hypothetical protein